MATTADLLQEAKDAYHRLMVGDAVAEVRDSTGETITYAKSRAADLLAYIRTMEPTFGLSCAPGPLRFVF